MNHCVCGIHQNNSTCLNFWCLLGWDPVARVTAKMTMSPSLLHKWLEVWNESYEICRSNMSAAFSIPIIKTLNERALLGRMVFQFYKTVPNTRRISAKAQWSCYTQWANTLLRHFISIFFTFCHTSVYTNYMYTVHRTLGCPTRSVLM